MEKRKGAFAGPSSLPSAWPRPLGVALRRPQHVGRLPLLPEQATSDAGEPFTGHRGTLGCRRLWNLAGERGLRLAFRVIVGLGEFVADLLEEPILAIPASHPRSEDGPFSSKLLAVEDEMDHAVLERRGRVGSRGSDHLIFAIVPHDDFARPVLRIGQGSLEQEIIERMVRYVDGEAPDRGILAGPLRHRPRNEDLTDLQPKVVVEAPRPVLLDPESVSRGFDVRIGFGPHG